MAVSGDRKHWVVLGQVGRPHGLVGALKARWYDPPAALDGVLKRVKLTLANGRAAEFTVDAVRPADATLGLLHLAQLSSAEEAGAWRGAQISVPAALVPPTEDDEVYLFELLGRQVYNADGRHLGRAAHLYDHGGGAILGIVPPLPAPAEAEQQATTATAMTTPGSPTGQAGGTAQPLTTARDANAGQSSASPVDQASPAHQASPNGHVSPDDQASPLDPTAPVRPRRGRRLRKRREVLAQEILVPLLPKVLRDVDAANDRVTIDLAFALTETT